MTKIALRWKLAALTVALFGASAPAWAVMPVTEDNPVMIAGAVAQKASLAELQGLNTLMGNYVSYMTTGDGQGGVIQLLAAQGQQLAQLNAYNGQFLGNEYSQNQAAKSVDLQAKNYLGYTDALAATTGGMDTPGCEAVGSSIAKGGAHSTSRANDSQVRNTVEARQTANRPEVATIADLVANRVPFCDANDVSNKRPACNAVGALPDADIDSKSLSQGAVNGTNGATPPSNVTFTAIQQQAAKAYLNNVLPLPAVQPQGGAANTPSGRQALVAFQRYNARVSPITEALSAIQSMNTPLAQTPDNWNDGDHQGAYGAGGRIFPNDVYPAQPSERELLRYQVFEAYQDPKKAAQWGTMSGDDLVREQLHLQALNARLQYLTVERLEEQNKLLSALLATQLDPVTAQTVKAQIPASAIPSP